MNVTEWQTKSEFESEIKRPGIQLIVFAAKWCGFCSRFIEQARSLGENGGLKLNLVDTDDPDESLWDEYSVKIVPTLFVFENGQVIFRRDGKSGAGLRINELEEAISMIKSAARQTREK